MMAIPRQELLEQVTDAFQAVSAAIQEGAPTPELQDAWNSAFLVLQQMDNDLVLQSEQGLLDALKANQQEITDLNVQIAQLSRDLDHTSELIKKVSDTVGMVVGVLGAVIAAGI